VTAGGRPAFADFHLHTHFSPDSLLEPERAVQLALERGLTHLSVTDHNTLDGARAALEAVAQLGLEGQLTVIPGEEVSSADGEIVGLFLESAVEPGLSAQATAEAIHAQGGLVSVPHPYDPFRRSHIGEEAFERLAAGGHVDAVEVFNCRVTFARHNERAAEFAAAHGLPGIAASDAHSTLEVAMAFNRLPWFTSAAELRAALPGVQWHASRSTKLVHLETRRAVLTHALRRRFGGEDR